MTDPRIVLDEYQRYVEAGKLDPVYDAARRAKLKTWQDITGDLVSALRAVLETIDGQHEYTCESSWLIGQIRNAITEALGGAQ